MTFVVTLTDREAIIIRRQLIFYIGVWKNEHFSVEQKAIQSAFILLVRKLHIHFGTNSSHHTMDLWYHEIKELSRACDLLLSEKVITLEEWEEKEIEKANVKLKTLLTNHF